MSIRSDLNKVLSYARSHGIKVHFRLRRKGGKDAAWILFESKTIVVCHSRSDPLRELLVSVLHELSHLITYCVDKSQFTAYLSVPEHNPSKAERYQIYLREREDIAKMPGLKDLLGLSSVPGNYVNFWVEYDTWQYRYFWLQGKYPNYKKRKDKRRQLGGKYLLNR